MSNFYDSTNRQTGWTILWNHLTDQIRHPWSHQSPLLYQYCKHLVSGTISSQKVGADWYHFTILNWLWMIYMQMLPDKQPETYWEITWKTKFGTPYPLSHQRPHHTKIENSFSCNVLPSFPFPLAFKFWYPRCVDNKKMIKDSFEGEILFHRMKMKNYETNEM